MNKVATGNFSRRGWNRERKDALEDIMIDHLPLYLANQQEKRKANAERAYAAKTTAQRKAIAERAAATRRQKKADENARIAQHVQERLQKRSQAAKKAAQTRKASNLPPQSWSLQWVHLLYWCKYDDDKPFYRERNYTEGNRFERSKDHRYHQVQAVRAEKGSGWMQAIAQRQDEFEDKRKDNKGAHFREALSAQNTRVFNNVRGNMTTEMAEALIDKHESEEGILLREDADKYTNDFITLETFVLSCVNISTGTSLEHMMLFDEAQNGKDIRPEYIPTGRCAINAVREAWGYGSDRAQRKGSKEILDDEWLMSTLGLTSLNKGINLSHIKTLSTKLGSIGFGAPYYCIDLEKDFVARHSCSKDWQISKSIRWVLPALYGFIYNNHFSIITDEDLQKSLRERSKSHEMKANSVDTLFARKNDDKCDEREQQQQHFVMVPTNRWNLVLEKILEIDSHEMNCIFILEDCDQYHQLESLFLSYVQTHRRISDIKTHVTSTGEARIQCIILPSKNHFTLDQDFQTRKTICEKLNIDFMNQSKPSISAFVFNEFYPNLKKSMMSPKLMDLFNTFAKPSIFYGNCAPPPRKYAVVENQLQYYWQRLSATETTVSHIDGDFSKQKCDAHNNELVAIDKPKCYRSSWYEMPLDFPVFSLYDDIELFCADKSKDGTVAGLYYIETKNVIPCEGDGWYSNVILQKCRDEKIPHKVTHMIIASRRIKHDYFRSYIDMVVSKTGKDAKILINSMIGLMGKKFTKDHLSTLFVPGIDEGVHYFNKFQLEKQWMPTIAQKFSKDLHGVDLYQVTVARTVTDMSTHRPIRKQIIDYANCLLYDMIKDTVRDISKVVAVKTDCIVVRKNDVFIENLYKYRIEDRLPEVHKPLNLPRRAQTVATTYPFPNKVELKILNGQDGAKMLLDAIKGQSCRIQAGAGRGKSHLLKGLRSHLENQQREVLVLAPTNCAAFNIDGKTIHKGLKISPEDTVSHLKHHKRPDDLLIDEISQIPSYLWNVITVYKQKGCRVFLFGDGNQLPPVEPTEDIYARDYLETNAVSDIADGNLVVLTENHRFTGDPSNGMHELVDAIQANDFEKHLSELYVDGVTWQSYKMNIAFTNQMCHHINTLHMKHNEQIAQKNKKKVLFSPKIEKDRKSQDCSFVKGSPVIARKGFSSKGVKVIKMTRWYVVDWDDKNVKCGSDHGPTCSVSRKNFQKFFLSGYCTTIHKAQGQTFKQHFVIHEVSKMTQKMLYTAVSRSSHSKYVHFSKIQLKDQMSDPSFIASLRQRFAHVEGCTFEEFLRHIQDSLNRFQYLKGMSWNDYGWDFEIDHIVPQAAGGSDHYTNLAPLDISENRRKQKRHTDVLLNKTL
ncbi:hypothetical protein HDU85_006880 [Gaertneriomyces sp. JEL0708]|nr:hypothetical protein HDU85_006880 [Gaertneriomyces sp. JEL0708]